MIPQSTILVVTPIAMEVDQKGTVLSEGSSDIIKGLNDTTASLGGFTPDNIATELPDYTKLVPEHTEVMDMVSTKLAEIIRSSLYEISKYVKPILKEADHEIARNLNVQNVVDLSFDYLNVKMVNMEPDFLNSPFCPTELPNTLKETSKVALNELLKGNWSDDKTGEELIDLIRVDSAVLYTFFESPDEVLEVYRQIFVNKAWHDFFSSVSIQNGVVDVMHQDSYHIGKFRAIVIANLLVNKLCAMEDPMEGVTGVSLVDYRGSLAMTRDILSGSLVRFRNIWLSQAASGIVIVDGDVKYTEANWGLLNGTKLLTGSVTVGYNNKVLNLFSEASSYSLSEYVLGYLYAKERGYRIKDIMTDANVIEAGFNEYQQDLRTRLYDNLQKVSKESFIAAVKHMEMHENFEGIVNTMDESVPKGVRILSKLQEAMNLNDFFGNPMMIEDICKGKSSLLQTGIAKELCLVFGSEIAAEILLENAKGEPGPVEHQRKVLTGAIIKAIIKRIYTK